MISNRAVALVCAVAQEAMRMYVDERREKPSLWSIQRDAENYYQWIETGAWKYVAVPHVVSRDGA